MLPLSSGLTVVLCIHPQNIPSHLKPVLPFEPFCDLAFSMSENAILLLYDVWSDPIENLKSSCRTEYNGTGMAETHLGIAVGTPFVIFIYSLPSLSPSFPPSLLFFSTEDRSSSRENFKM